MRFQVLGAPVWQWLLCIVGFIVSLIVLMVLIGLMMALLGESY